MENETIVKILMFEGKPHLKEGWVRNVIQASFTSATVSFRRITWPPRKISTMMVKQKDNLLKIICQNSI